MRTTSRMWQLLCGVLIVSGASVAAAAFAPVKLDPVHTKLSFTAETLLFNVEGEFKKRELWLEGDPNKPETAKIKLVVDTASVFTDNDKRDEHLRSSDFFDAKKYPQITFASTKIEGGTSSLKVTGTLDMHGTQRTLTIPFKVVQGKNGAGTPTTAYKGKLTLKRSDYGIGAASVAAKLSMEDEVELELLVVAFH